MQKIKTKLLSIMLILTLAVGFVGIVSADLAYAASKRPDFGAIILDYKTRSNCFVVIFKNQGNKKLTITEGLKAINVDYKSFDRKLRLKKKVVVKPGAEKKVKFYVKGRTTWYDSDDFKIYYKFKYNGKTYKAKAWVDEGDCESKYKAGKKWKNTFTGGDYSWHWDWVEYEYY